MVMAWRKIGPVAICCAVLHEASPGRTAAATHEAVVLPVASEPQGAIVAGAKKTFVPLGPQATKDLARPRMLKLVLRPIVVDPAERLLVRAQLCESERGADVVIDGEADIAAPGAAMFKPPRVGDEEVFFITLDPWKNASPPKSIAIYIIAASETPFAIKSKFEIVSATLLP